MLLRRPELTESLTDRFESFHVFQEPAAVRSQHARLRKLRVVVRLDRAEGAALFGSVGLCDGGRPLLGSPQMVFPGDHQDFTSDPGDPHVLDGLSDRQGDRDGRPFTVPVVVTTTDRDSSEVAPEIAGDDGRGELDDEDGSLVVVGREGHREAPDVAPSRVPPCGTLVVSLGLLDIVGDREGGGVFDGLHNLRLRVVEGERYTVAKSRGSVNSLGSPITEFRCDPG